MSNDYTALINGEEEVVTEEPITFSASRAADEVTWYRRASGYTYTNHEDDNFSQIDEYKVVHLDDKQINITQENRGQYIPFETLRYYDNIDLAQAAFTVKYLRKGETVPKEEVTVNLEYTDTGDKKSDRIRFGWIPSSVATEFAGPLPFEIVASGLGPDGNAYTWKTQTVEKDLQVLQGLGESEEIEILDTWKEEIVDMFAAAVASSGLSAYALTADVDAKDATTLNSARTYTDEKSVVDLAFDRDDDYNLVIKITFGDGDEISKQVDLPLESVVVDAKYDKESKDLILELQNGNEVEIPLDDVFTGLATEDFVNTQINTKIGEIGETDVATYVTNSIATAVAAAIETVNNTVDVAIKQTEEKIEAINDKIGELGESETVIEYVDTAINSIDVTDVVYTKEEVDAKFGNLGTHLEGTEEEPIEVANTVEYFVNNKLGDFEDKTVKVYIDEAIDSIDVTDIVYTKEEIDTKLGVLEREEGVPLSVKEYVDSIDVTNTVYTKAEVDDLLENVSVDLSDYYTKDQTDSAITTELSSELSAYATKTFVQQQIDSASSNQLTYDVSYNNPEDLDGGENAFVFYEIENEGLEDEKKTVKKKFTITGGAGGSGGLLKINFVTTSPVTAIDGNKVIIEYKFEGTDSSDEPINDATATWKVGARVVATEPINSFGDDGQVKINSFDITNYLNIGSQKVTLTVEDDSGNKTSKNWTVNVLDIRIESDFDDTVKRTAGQPVTFTYKPYGAIDKIVHIVFNKTDNRVTLDKSITNTTQTFTIPAQPHGSYLLEAYITATVNGTEVRSDSIYKDIIFFNPLASAPVIGTIYQNFSIKQYDTLSIPVTVYDPNSATPTVDIYVDKVLVTTKNLFETNTFVYDYKESVAGEHTIELVCGDTTKTLKATVQELGITVNPIVAGLAFDFNPSGKNNDVGNREWEDRGVTMTVSDNFDWINGGYKTDENGDYYFRVKAGTTATINHNLFADDAKANGKEFKVVFKTENIRNRDTNILTCIDGGVGLEMKVEEANIYSNNGSLYSPYCENDIIEFEFNISKCKFNDDGTQEGTPIVLTYEDGVANRPMVYTKDSSFWQTNVQPITIGSQDCDVLIYRMKAYTNQLEDNEILANFIADARNANEMILRYERNQIYNNSGQLDPDALAKACPDLRIIMIEAPWFTNDKDDKVEGTTVTMRYENGDKYLDNWVCINALHSGQGTSSNDYGYSGRNLDLIMNEDNSEFTFADSTKGKTITLTRNSVPTNYLNIKVNIASSENQNNAQMAERYNRFNPFIRTARLKDSKVKDTMEFYNCVVFIRETDPNINLHREFNDTNWHFYAIGNVGDSKKTDKTRVNDKNDPKECVVEIMDYNVPLAEFPTGYEDGYTTCPVELWNRGNTAYDQLYGKGVPTTVGSGEDAVEYDEKGYTYKKGKIKSFGYSSYEFRYEKSDITLEEQENNIETWRNFYTFLVTSDDATIKRDFEKYFVLDSALYFYLFTERYTMVDNRAKNSFWHYGKVYYSSSDVNIPDGIDAKYVNDEQAAFNDGYRWDLTFGYDFDTSLGIDNTGKLVLTYGKEDEDQYSDDGTDTRMIYRAAKSNFFMKLKRIFSKELKDMFVNRESKGAWSSEDLIAQWDKMQAQFPEELWRLDIQRKYIRTFTGASVDNSKKGEPTARFLAEMLNGRKKYQRRMFERNQEIYMATKYFGTTATNDKITFRFNNPETYVIKPDFTLRITPYSDMYIGVQPGAVSPTNFRAKAGREYEIPYALESATADITNIFGAKFIQAIGDLSACYVGDNDLSKATRLQSISIGTSVPRLVENLNGFVSSITEEGNYKYGFTPINTGVPTLYTNIKIKEVNSATPILTINDFGLEVKDGTYYIVLNKTTGNVVVDAAYSFIVEYDAYFNNYMKKLSLGNNALLEFLDIRNVTGLESAIDLSNCGNLREIKAEGAGATGIVFAAGGRLQKATLPKIKTLTAKNLNELIEFNVASYENLESLVVENTPKIETYAILEEAKNLKILRLVGIEWPKTLNIPDGTVLDRALKMRGNNASGGEIAQSVISGVVNITNMRQAQLDNYNAAWPTLKVNYDYLIKQYYARFYNGLDLVDIQLIDESQIAVDPTTRKDNPIPIPTKDSTVQLKYEFIGWSPENFDPMYSDKKYEAQYSSSPMQYTISYTGLGVEPYSATVDYGTMVEYPHGTPTYSDAANKYYLFRNWDKSGYANKDKVITAQYDTCSYQDGYFKEKELNKLTPVELLMLTKTAGVLFNLGTDTEYLAQKEIDIPFGNDFVYETEDIDNKVLIESPMVFNGTSSRLDTYEILMDGKKDFVLAVDFRRDPFNTNTTMFQSYNPSSSAGFRVNCTDNETELVWGTKTIKLETDSNFGREMLVLRHKAGENKLYVYYSQKDKEEKLKVEMDALQEPIDALSLVFGCRKSGTNTYTNYAAGTVYWSKLWYADLGESICQQLAAWPHEEKTFITCSAGNNTPEYGTQDGIATLVLMAKYVTDKQYPLNNIGVWSNIGGWKDQTIRNYLENKVYAGINSQYKDLVKLTKVRSGTWNAPEFNQSLVTITETNDHIFIPAKIELESSYNDNEITAGESVLFDQFDGNDKRIGYTAAEVPSPYWTRTLQQNGDWGFQYVKADGGIYTYGESPSTERNLRYMITI